MIELKVKDVLVNARKAFDAGELQIQKDSEMEVCKYSGPCAIGISVPIELAHKWDNLHLGAGIAIDSLVSDKEVETDDVVGLSELQLAHDSGVIPRFEQTLIELETKHGIR